MDFLNRVVTSVFDLALSALGWLGAVGTLVLVSAVSGVLALAVFKQISFQRGIRATKDRIKGHMIAIRIYQNDLGIVVRSVGSVLGRNFQYLGLNFGPILPLIVPFVLIVAQLVVRFGFAPIPVEDRDPAELLAGQGITIEVRLVPERAREVSGLELELPRGLVAISPLVRVPSEGLAFQEVIAVEEGDWELGLRLPGELQTKRVVTGEAVPAGGFQPERVRSFWAAWLWPAEPLFPSDSAFDRVLVAHPERDLGWVPGGPIGIVLTFLVVSLLAGFLALKPLGVEI